MFQCTKQTFLDFKPFLFNMLLKWPMSKYKAHFQSIVGWTELTDPECLRCQIPMSSQKIVMFNLGTYTPLIS